MFTLSFDTDTDDFVPDASFEVARILESVSEKVKSGFDSGNVFDTNGNTVGEWFLKTDDSDHFGHTDCE